MLFECDKILKTKGGKFYGLVGMYPALELGECGWTKTNWHSAVDVLNGNTTMLTENQIFSLNCDDNPKEEIFEIYAFYILYSTWAKYEKFSNFINKTQNLKEIIAFDDININSLFESIWLECFVCSYSFLHMFASAPDEFEKFSEKFETNRLNNYAYKEFINNFPHSKINREKFSKIKDECAKEYDLAAMGQGRVGSETDPFRRFYYDGSGRLTMQIDWRHRLIFTLISRILFKSYGYDDEDLVYKNDEPFFCGNAFLDSAFQVFLLKNPTK